MKEREHIKERGSERDGPPCPYSNKIKVGGQTRRKKEAEGEESSGSSSFSNYGN